MTDAAAESGWDRRRKLLLSEYEQIALELFAERGFKNVTFDEISEVAGVSGRTLFRYFATKEEFLLSFPRRGVANLVDAIAEFEPSATPLEAAWKQLRDRSLENRPDVETLTLWRHAAADAPEVVARVRGERMQALMDALTAYCADALGSDPINDARPGLLAGILAGAEMAVVEMWGRSEMSLDEIFDSAASSIPLLSGDARRRPR
jgi:AcrR family transcriptional regulator